MEMAYVNHMSRVDEEIERIKRHKAERLETARANGKLGECGCCYDDEVLPEEMATCEFGLHSFCVRCIERHANEIIGCDIFGETIFVSCFRRCFL